jgi:hypothetical protein
MPPTFSTRVVSLVGTATLALLTATPVARGDSIERARIELDLTDPARIGWTTEFDWYAEGDAPFLRLEVHLSRDVSVTAGFSEGKDLLLSHRDVYGTWMRIWSVELPTMLEPGHSRTVTLRGSIVPQDSPGLHQDERGGFLLPDSGWFPRTSMEMEELVAHVTTFTLPPTMTGIAAGRPAPEGGWEAEIPGRPYAVWGEYVSSEHTGGDSSASEETVVLYRRAEDSGPPPRIDTILQVIRSHQAGLGDAAGSGPWRLIDVGKGVVSGGQRTLFWDESAARSITGEPASTLLDRDLAGALAAGFWTESIRFRHGTGPWLARAIPLYLGDAAVSAFAAPENRLARESIVIGSRREAFLKGIQRDRAISEVSALSLEGRHVLETRGALVAHLMAEAAGSESDWIEMLSEFRTENEGRIASGKDFRDKLRWAFADQHGFLAPYIGTTQLPDFRIVSHEVVADGRGGEQLRVEVENRGQLKGMATIAVFTPEGDLLRDYDLVIPSDSTKAIFLRDPGQVGRVVVDPRGVNPQSDLTDEIVEIRPGGRAD